MDHTEKYAEHDGCRCIRGIICDVENCVHNDKSQRCTAEAIRVGPTFANQREETICDTFKNR